MRARMIKQGSPLVSAAETVYIPKGKWAGFLLRCAGTAAGGITFANTDIGRIRLNHRGEDLMNVTGEFLHLFTNLKGGFPEATSAVGAGYAFSLWIPVNHVRLPNVLDCGSNEEAYFQFNWGANFVGATAGAWELQGIPADAGIQRYSLKIAEQNMIAGAAGRLQQTLAAKNIASILIRDAGTVVNRVTVREDGEIAIDADDNIIRALTSINNRIEAAIAAAAGLGEIDFGNAGEIALTFNDEVSMDVNFTAAGTCEVWHMSIKPMDAGNVQVSAQRSTQKLISRYQTVRRSSPQSAIAGGSGGAVPMQRRAPLRDPRFN